MLAAVDAGSNTLRLLIGRVAGGRVLPDRYLRRICRLAGGFNTEKGLSPSAMERTLLALKDFSAICEEAGVSRIAAVGTAAFRMAGNGPDFADEICRSTGIPMQIISGETEAGLMATGVLSVLDSTAAATLIVDIGGGSTELVLVIGGEVRWFDSLPLGVVRITEAFPSTELRQAAVLDLVKPYAAIIATVCAKAGVAFDGLAVAGTAGTVTTLAALDMQMGDYDWRRVNGYRLPLNRIESWQKTLTPMNPLEREAVVGMEAGRGDLIVTGIDIVLAIMGLVAAHELIVSDFGLLEGLLLSMATGADDVTV